MEVTVVAVVEEEVVAVEEDVAVVVVVGPEAVAAGLEAAAAAPEAEAEEMMTTMMTMTMMLPVHHLAELVLPVELDEGFSTIKRWNSNWLKSCKINARWERDDAHAGITTTNTITTTYKNGRRPTVTRRSTSVRN